MELIRKSYEESFFRPCRISEKPCESGLNCQGHVLASILPDCPYSGFILPAFYTPLGKQYSHCPICIRAQVTKKWLLSDKPDEILQPWKVSLLDYDEDACIVPLTYDINDPAPFSGFIHPFPRYTSLSFYFSDKDTIKQRGVAKRMFKYWTNQPIYATPRKYLISGMLDVYDVSFCVLLCGLFNNYIKTPGVVSIMHKALSSKSSIYNIDRWILSVLDNSNKGVYPHCKGTTNSMPTILAIREYILFVVEYDAVLREVARTMHEDWHHFATDTLESCNSFRTTGVFVSHKFKLLTPTKGFSKLYRNIRPSHSVDYPLDVYDLEEQLNNKLVHPVVYDIIKKEIDAYDYKQIPLEEGYPLAYYVCKHCNQYKGPKIIINKHNKYKQSHKSGNTHVQFDIYTGLNKCFKKRSGGRSKEINLLEKARDADNQNIHVSDTTCSNNCDTLITGSHLAHMKDVCIGACEICKTCFNFTGHSILYGHVCPICIANLPLNTKIYCDVCGKQSKKSLSNWIHINCVTDGANTKMKTINICKKDSGIKFLSQTPYWTKMALMDMITSYKLTQHTKKRARHTQRC